MFFGFGPCSGFQSAPAMGPVVAQELCHWHTMGLFTRIWFDKPLSLPLLFQHMCIYTYYISRLLLSCRWPQDDNLMFFYRAACCKITTDFYFCGHFIFCHIFPESSIGSFLESSPPRSKGGDDHSAVKPMKSVQTLQYGAWMKFRENHITSVELMHRSDFQHVAYASSLF